jgi:hypothetical protein
MQARDWLTAVVIAVILMALGVAATFGWVAIYSHVIDPGHPVEVYQAYANKHAPWIGVYVGVPLWFLAGWWIARSRDRARAVDTAFGTGFVYAGLDIAIIGAMGALGGFVGVILISVTSKTVCAAAGAWLGAKQ